MLARSVKVNPRWSCTRYVDHGIVTGAITVEPLPIGKAGHTKLLG
jgi:hypothetical protein